MEMVLENLCFCLLAAVGRFDAIVSEVLLFLLAVGLLDVDCLLVCVCLLWEVRMQVVSELLCVCFVVGGPVGVLVGSSRLVYLVSVGFLDAGCFSCFCGFCFLWVFWLQVVSN
jgi:hypothetical protein